MLAKNAPHLLDRLGMALRGMSRTHDLLRLDPVDVRALVGDDAVCLSGRRTLALYRDDGVRRDARVDREACKGPHESTVRAHVIDRCGELAESELRELR